MSNDSIETGDFPVDEDKAMAAARKVVQPPNFAAGYGAGQAGAVTDAMVTAYLKANMAYWQAVDTMPESLTRWRTGTPFEATRQGLQAVVESLRPEPAVDSQLSPVGYCALTASGKIAYFEGRPMVMPGEQGNELHQHRLYALIKGDQKVNVNLKDKGSEPTHGSIDLYEVARQWVVETGSAFTPGMAQLLHVLTGYVSGVREAEAERAEAALHGNLAPDAVYSDDQWWFKELQAAAVHGSLDRRSAVAVVRRLLDDYAAVTTLAVRAASVDSQEAFEQAQKALGVPDHQLAAGGPDSKASVGYASRHIQADWELWQRAVQYGEQKILFNR